MSALEWVRLRNLTQSRLLWALMTSWRKGGKVARAIHDQSKAPLADLICVVHFTVLIQPLDRSATRSQLEVDQTREELAIEMELARLAKSMDIRTAVGLMRLTQQAKVYLELHLPIRCMMLVKTQQQLWQLIITTHRFSQASRDAVLIHSLYWLIHYLKSWVTVRYHR